MKRKLWIRIGAVVLAALLLWWLFWAILIDEDENDQGLPETEQIEKVCRNARCTFFLVYHYINRFIFFKLR